MAATKAIAVSNLARSRRMPRCAHVRPNGLRCGSPALRGNVFCFFHDKWLSAAADDILPPLEDGNGIQFSLMYVVSRLRKEAFRDGAANIPAVKQLLYALQTAAYNLRNCNFEPTLAQPTTDSLGRDNEETDPVVGAGDSPARTPAPVPAEPGTAAFDSDQVGELTRPGRAGACPDRVGADDTASDSHSYGSGIPTRAEIERRFAEAAAAKKAAATEPAEAPEEAQNVS